MRNMDCFSSKLRCSKRKLFSSNLILSATFTFVLLPFNKIAFGFSNVFKNNLILLIYKDLFCVFKIVVMALALFIFNKAFAR